jgi:hypothetical protein
VLPHKRRDAQKYIMFVEVSINASRCREGGGLVEGYIELIFSSSKTNKKTKLASVQRDKRRLGGEILGVGYVSIEHWVMRPRLLEARSVGGVMGCRLRRAQVRCMAIMRMLSEVVMHGIWRNHMIQS